MPSLRPAYVAPTCCNKSVGVSKSAMSFHGKILVQIPFLLVKSCKRIEPLFDMVCSGIQKCLSRSAKWFFLNDNMDFLYSSINQNVATYDKSRTTIWILC